MQQLLFIIINYLYMFRASICPSSGVQVVCYLEIINDNKSQVLHQVATPRHFPTICTVTHTSNLLVPNRPKTFTHARTSKEDCTEPLLPYGST